MLSSIFLIGALFIVCSFAAYILSSRSRVSRFHANLALLYFPDSFCIYAPSKMSSFHSSLPIKLPCDFLSSSAVYLFPFLSLEMHTSLLPPKLTSTFLFSAVYLSRLKRPFHLQTLIFTPLSFFCNFLRLNDSLLSPFRILFRC